MANILLFVAPVLLAGVATRRPVLVMVAGSGLSVVVEVCQAAVPALGRSCDSGDWVNNTIGTVIGALLALLALAPHSSRFAALPSGGGGRVQPWRCRRVRSSGESR
jgi:VanZ family protein